MKIKRLKTGVFCLCAFGSMMAATPAMPRQQEGYLSHLYKTMPPSDSVDYPRDFFKRNVDVALKARHEMPWGKTVPEREFLYFVLPVRVNNENLDDARTVFYEQLAPRVKGMTMEEAALEVNHWAHEKMNYRGSDARTSSPLASLRTSWGRCGEESTFAVAALRSVGIPARQVYTPRWAHTDDNHAWVEAWIDGKWHFLGACEPEPRLDLAWFTGPASRAMLMHTTILGEDYDGPEEVISCQNGRTEINVTANYAPVDTVHVTVVDKKGKPVKDATVRFCIYNYNEFYPAVTKKSDTDGNASLAMGRGDMVVWASDGKNYGVAKLNGADGKALNLPLDKDMNYVGTFDFDIVPPATATDLPFATPEEAKANQVRLAYEDSVRTAYNSTFYTLETGTKRAAEMNLDQKRVGKILRDAYGNYPLIETFLAQAPDKQRAIELLELVSDKDRRDISAEALKDHYENSCSNDPDILNPRVADEMLVAYRKFFTDTVFPALNLQPTPESLTAWQQWVSSNVIPGPAARFYLTPQGVWKVVHDTKANGVVSGKARDVFFVAGARSMGIPSRVDPVTLKTQVRQDDKWVDMALEKVTENPQGPARTPVHLNLKGQEGENPEYYFAFTLSKIEDGLPELMNYPEDYRASDLADIELAPGQYILTTGKRQANGSVLTRSHIFNVGSEPATFDFDMRQLDSTLAPLEIIDADTPLLGDLHSYPFAVVMLMRQGHEPSTHAVRDMEPYLEKIQALGIPVWQYYTDQDTDGQLAAHIGYKEALAPTVIIVNVNGKVFYRTDGYTIGTGKNVYEQVQRLLK